MHVNILDKPICENLKNYFFFIKFLNSYQMFYRTNFFEDFFSDTRQIFNKKTVCLDPVKQLV